MPEQVSNRRVLYMFLFLGLVVVPSIGIIGAVFGPSETREGKPIGMGTKIGFPAFFICAGAAFVAYASRRCPVSFDFDDSLTVRYLFHQRVIHRDEIADTSVRLRSTTVGGH